MVLIDRGSAHLGPYQTVPERTGQMMVKLVQRGRGQSGGSPFCPQTKGEEIRFFCSSIVSRSFMTFTSSISVMLFVLALLLLGLFLYVVAVPRSLNPALSSDPATLS